MFFNIDLYNFITLKVNSVFILTRVHFKRICLGFTAITATNPIWLVKTRLQLDARYVISLMVSANFFL